MQSYHIIIQRVRERERDEMLDIQKIDKTYYYDGDDLGCTYTKEFTTFRVWAPTAEKVTLHLYSEGDGDCLLETVPMMLDKKGTWYTKVQKDLEGLYYTYLVQVAGKTNEVNDVYAKAAGVNGQRAMILDFTKTDPQGWQQDKGPELKRKTDAVIYELHVRDLSADPSSGIAHPYIFTGLTETGTKSPDGLATGFDHIKELGVTHVHLLPLHDFGSVDERYPEKNKFNWGYDPLNYNVLEGSYSSDPYHGEVRVREFKEVVQHFHKHGIGIVMDVVYNHTYRTKDSYFELTVPGYYYRMNGDEFLDASACGNETASEHKMMRKYMVDSLCFFAKEYHIDGFRFDLMGIHDVDTMNVITQKLREIRPDILLYGEGWAAGPVALPEGKSAKKADAAKMPGLAMFNDNIRDAVKGHVFYKEEPGFVNGKPDMEEEIRFSVVGATKHSQVLKAKEPAWAASAAQSVNYISAHDDLTLWDKFAITNPKDSEEVRKNMNKLAAAIVFTAQGIPFIQAGEELLRTKPSLDKNNLYESNSYNSPDSVNSLKWGRKKTYEDVFAYYKGLIAFRKEHSALRMVETEKIEKNLQFLQMPENVVAFTIQKPDEEECLQELCIIYNANRTAKNVEIPKGSWEIFVDKEKAGVKSLRSVEGGKIEIPPISAMVLGR